ncbi:restriction endonuclease subunit S [Lacticaseibacillus paracasei]|uniref:restriction endonuclease subunit S n=1 Tax=Lacticaseibacillus paracasei TaxID=1597 RepID=UPI0034A3744E
MLARNAWEKRKLGEVATITMGQSPDSKNYTLNPQDHILVQGNADIKNGWVEPRVWTTQITKIAKKGSVLLSVRAPVGEVSKTAFDVVLGRGVASVGQTDFLYQYLITLKINGFWLRYSTGSTFDSINSADIKDAIIFLPEKNEQSRIAKTLNCIDNLIAATQDKIDALEQAKRALLQRLFDQSWRFKGYSDPWEKRKLREVSDVRDGTHASPKYYSQGYPLVTSKNLTSAGLDFSNISLISELDYKNINKRSRVDKGDILFGMIGTIGTPVMVHESNFAIKNVALIKEREAVLNSFLVQLLKSPAFINYIRNENVGGTQKFLSLNTIRNFRFSFPTSKEQAMVSRFLEKIDSLIAATQSRLSSLELLKKALLQDLFI